MSSRLKSKDNEIYDDGYLSILNKILFITPMILPITIHLSEAAQSQLINLQWKPTQALVP